MLKRPTGIWNDLKETALSFLYEEQKGCLLCESVAAAGTVICPDCIQKYFHPELGRCHQCGKLIPHSQAKCKDCRDGIGPKGLDQVAAWGHYSGAWREWIQAVKFKAQPYKLKRIARPLADWAIRILPPPHYLVSVPMHFERLAERGFNQAAVIASLLHWELGIPILDVLERTSITSPQVGLNRKERLHNLDGVFQVVNPRNLQAVRGAKIWLVDDVTTTGATFEACAAALKEKGAEEVLGLALAAGME